MFGRYNCAIEWENIGDDFGEGKIEKGGDYLEEGKDGKNGKNVKIEIKIKVKVKKKFKENKLTL